MKQTEELTAIETAATPAPPWLVVMGTLWRNRHLFARFFIVGLILSTALAFFIPSSYNSTVQLMPPDWQSTSSRLAASISAIPLVDSGGAGIAGGAGLAGLLNSRDSAGPLLGIIASRTMRDDLISRFDLQRVYHVRHLVDARKILGRRTDAKEDKPTGIISIVVTDHDPVRARDLAAAYVEELDKLVVTMDTSAAHRERLFMEQRLKDVQSDLESSEQQLSHFSSRTETMDQNTQSKAMLDAISSVQGELIAAQSELHGLQTTYSDESVLVKQAKARVATLSGELQKLEGARGNDSSGADADQAYPSLRQLPLLGVTYADLYRRTKTLEVAYELLNREFEAAKIEEAEEIPSVKILDPPVIAQEKSFPPRILLIAAGAFLSLFFCGLWIMGREVWCRIDPSDPVKVLASEVAASFGHMSRKS
ncbi:MAG: lipopolysaccharide biosynthesis protein [Terracidiphilus sp.]